MATTTPKIVRIPFDSLTLRAVVAELSPLLVGGQIQDVRQPAPTELQLGIRSQRQNFLLHLSCDARFARSHLTATRLPNPPTPPGFCQILRKWIEDSYIRDIRQRDFDRVMEIDAETWNEEGEQTTVTLIAELMGKHSNLILVNAKGVILDSAKRITSRINRFRETLPGLPYQTPPDQNDKRDPFAPDALEELGSESDLRDLSEKELTDLLIGQFAGMSPFLAQEIALRTLESPTRRAGLQAAWKTFFSTADTVLPTADGSAFSPVEILYQKRTAGAYPFPLKQIPAAQQQPAPSLNFALDSSFAFMLERAAFDAAAGDLKARLDREIKWRERQRQSADKTLAEAAKSESYQQTGELILANLWKIQPGDTSVTVQDYFDPAYPDRVIALDTTLTPQENAEHWFQRYHKARAAASTGVERNVQATESLDRLKEAQAQVVRWITEFPQTAETVQSLRDALIEAALLRRTEEAGEESKARHPDFEGHRIRRYTTPEGYEIYCGESATANDFLTTRIAAPNDIWLHVRSSASSHVVIRTAGKPERVPHSVLLHAAAICARHSAQKHSSLVAVDYTLKKYVRKPRGSAPGGADYQKESTLHVAPGLDSDREG